MTRDSKADTHATVHGDSYQVQGFACLEILKSL
jgi:hypothetical protein